MFYFRNPLGQGAQLMVLGAILAPLVSTTCVPSSDELNSPLLKDKVFGSDVVAHGTVARHFPDPRWPSAFIAELLVQCVYKGGPLDSVINITQAGRAPEFCLATQLDVGSKYIVYLSRQAGTLVPSFVEDPAEQKYFEELLIVCDVKAQYPRGVSQNDQLAAECNPNSPSLEYMDEDCAKGGNFANPALRVHPLVLVSSILIVLVTSLL